MRYGQHRAALVAAVLLATAGLVAMLSLMDDGPDAPPVADAATLALGAEVYAANCATCHGERGEGAPDWRSPGPGGRMPPPPHDAEGHTWHHGDGLLFRIVRDGCGAYPVSARDRCAMPAFGGRLSAEEIRAVIDHLKTWWGEDERAFQTERSREDPYP